MCSRYNSNNHHNLEMLSNVCSVYHHEEVKKERLPSPLPNGRTIS